jgi:hypothetical protein
MKQLFLCLTLLFFSSCSCKWAARFLEKHPECQTTTIVTKDTTIYLPGDTLQGEIILIVDSSAINTLKTMLAQCGEDADYLASQIASFIPIAVRTAQPVDTTTDIYHLQMWVESGKISFNLQVFPKEVIVTQYEQITNLVPQRLKKDKILIRWLIALSVVLLLLLMMQYFYRFIKSINQDENNYY